jgi:hypothetical protein
MEAGESLTFNYTGGVQTARLPVGIYDVVCYGAAGGFSAHPNLSGARPGYGGMTRGRLFCLYNTVINVYVGGQGGNGSIGRGGSGGWGGGGAGQWDYINRVVANADLNPDGGGLEGLPPGYGGTQTGGAALGQGAGGAIGVSDSPSSAAGGGGGGYYGGRSANTAYGISGGGSGFASAGHILPELWSGFRERDVFFEEAQYSTGARNGDGFVQITAVQIGFETKTVTGASIAFAPARAERLPSRRLGLKLPGNPAVSSLSRIRSGIVRDTPLEAARREKTAAGRTNKTAVLKNRRSRLGKCLLFKREAGSSAKRTKLSKMLILSKNFRAYDREKRTNALLLPLLTANLYELNRRLAAFLLPSAKFYNRSNLLNGFVPLAKYSAARTRITRAFNLETGCPGERRKTVLGLIEKNAGVRLLWGKRWLGNQIYVDDGELQFYVRESGNLFNEGDVLFYVKPSDDLETPKCPLLSIVLPEILAIENAALEVLGGGIAPTEIDFLENAGKELALRLSAALGAANAEIIRLAGQSVEGENRDVESLAGAVLVLENADKQASLAHFVLAEKTKYELAAELLTFFERGGRDVSKTFSTVLDALNTELNSLSDKFLVPENADITPFDSLFTEKITQSEIAVEQLLNIDGTGDKQLEQSPYLSAERAESKDLTPESAAAAERGGESGETKEISPPSAQAELDKEETRDISEAEADIFKTMGTLRHLLTFAGEIPLVLVMKRLIGKDGADIPTDKIVRRNLLVELFGLTEKKSEKEVNRDFSEIFVDKSTEKNVLSDDAEQGQEKGNARETAVSDETGGEREAAKEAANNLSIQFDNSREREISEDSPDKGVEKRGTELWRLFIKALSREEISEKDLAKDDPDSEFERGEEDLAREREARADKIAERDFWQIIRAWLDKGAKNAGLEAKGISLDADKNIIPEQGEIAAENDKNIVTLTIKFLEIISPEINVQTARDLTLYSRFWFLLAAGETDKKIVPNADYPYGDEPLVFEGFDDLMPENWQVVYPLELWKGVDKHPIEAGTSLGRREIPLAINIMLDCINIIIMMWCKFFKAFWGWTGTQAVVGLVTEVCAWITLEASRQAADIAHYDRVYRWIRWEGENIVIQARNDMELRGNYWVCLFIEELVNYMNDHHFDVCPIFDDVRKMDEWRNTANCERTSIEWVLDKIKGIRHKFIEGKEQKTMYSLRQKTYGVFIRPYIMFGGEVLPRRGNLYTVNPCQPSGASCTAYSNALGGEAWMLYKGEYLTSFAIVRERVKEIMDELGYSKNDIHVCEVVPIDNIVTPLA